MTCTSKAIKARIHKRFNQIYNVNFFLSLMVDLVKMVIQNLLASTFSSCKIMSFMIWTYTYLPHIVMLPHWCFINPVGLKPVFSWRNGPICVFLSPHSCGCHRAFSSHCITPVNWDIFCYNQAAVCLSVHLSDCPSTFYTFFTMFLSSYHHEMFERYCQWQKWCLCKRSRSEVKVQGHRVHNPI